jgi:hypothetical protein
LACFDAIPRIVVILRRAESPPKDLTSFAITNAVEESADAASIDAISSTSSTPPAEVRSLAPAPPPLRMTTDESSDISENLENLPSANFATLKP